jgi:hypothetical protein
MEPLVGTPDPTWMTAPGTGRGPLEGHPHADLPTVLNGHPRERVSLGTIAGHEVVIETESLDWLGEAAQELLYAQSRLAMFLPRAAHPFGDNEDGAAA